ncbi:MAG: type II toxin-antitoxin system RelE/ParE family toxin [Pseudonocardiaceae bacterium]
MPWQVVVHPEAEAELRALPRREEDAMLNAIDKLIATGPLLRFPHQSDVRGGDGLRELRPRQGRSPWRALYGRKADVFVVAAIAPEAEVNQRGFDRAIRSATARLAEVED